MHKTELDLAQLLLSWEVSLRAERKSPQTLKSYGDGVRAYLTWCDKTGHEPALVKSQVTAFVADLLDAGAQPSTARSRLLAVRRFSAWLLEEREIDQDVLAGMRSPKLESKVVQPLEEDQLKALVRACVGPELLERRDEAIVRLMVETGARAGEVVNLRLRDVDLKSSTAVITRSKTGQGRSVPFGPQTARALDRYLRARRGHRLADSDDLWLGSRGRQLSYDGLYAALKKRALAAGIPNFHPHLLRHTAAHRWLAAGGTEGGLMAVAGWTRPEMLVRYTRAQASQRAADEARNLNLGDF